MNEFNTVQYKVRTDDDLFCKYLLRNLSGGDGARLNTELLRSVESGRLQVSQESSSSDELVLIFDILSKRVFCPEYKWDFPPYLSAFRSLMSGSCLPPIAWDNDFQKLYDVYLRSPCASYYRTTTEILAAFVAQNQLNEVQILDLGSGSGILMEEVVSKLEGKHVHAICVDSNLDALLRAQKRIPGCQILHADLNSLYLNATGVGFGPVDVVLASMSLHHLPADAKREMVAWIRKILRPNGLLILNEMYGRFEGLASSSFRLVFNVVKYFALESQLLWSHLQSSGNDEDVEKLLVEFFGREIASLIGEHPAIPQSEACLYPEEWCDLLLSAGFQFFQLRGGALSEVGSSEHVRHMNTCEYELSSHEATIPLLYTVCARPVV